MITIEKGIPLPAGRKKGFLNDKTPIDQLEVGDSFVIPMEHEKVTKSISRYGKTHGKGFVVRELDDKTGFRVWRKS